MIEIVEGKGTPLGCPPKNYAEHKKTAGLLLHLTSSFHGTAKLVVLDSGFCVLKELVELRKKGVFRVMMIKKQKHWPKHVKGDYINKCLKDKEPGNAKIWTGELEGTKADLHLMKEPDYMMLFISTIRMLQRMGNPKKQCDKTICYTEIIHNHYLYQDLVDSHNSMKMYAVALEEI